MDAVASAFAYEWRIQGAWIETNFVLAVLPGLGALLLYLLRRHLSALWWLGLVVVGLLLPNAPYVVTDLIHLYPAVHWAPSTMAVVAGVVPLFVGLIASGVLSYALALHLLRKSMVERGWSKRRRLSVDVTVNVLCGLGVALGRVLRLNSWDVIHPQSVLDGLTALASHPQAVMLALLVVLVAGVATDLVATEAVHHLRASSSWTRVRRRL